jgi:hypothetical protein
MRQRFLQVLESDDKDLSDDAGEALGRFWPGLRKVSRNALRASGPSRPEQGAIVDLATWVAAQRRSTSRTR